MAHERNRDERLLSTSEFARAFGVSDTTVRRWVRDGRTIPDRRTAGGQMRWLQSTVNRLMREWNP